MCLDYLGIVYCIAVNKCCPYMLLDTGTVSTYIHVVESRDILCCGEKQATVNVLNLFAQSAFIVS